MPMPGQGRVSSQAQNSARHGQHPKAPSAGQPGRSTSLAGCVAAGTRTWGRRRSERAAATAATSSELGRVSRQWGLKVMAWQRSVSLHRSLVLQSRPATLYPHRHERSGRGKAGGGPGEWALGGITETLEARTWVENPVLGIPEELFAFFFLFFYFLLLHVGRWEGSTWLLFSWKRPWNCRVQCVFRCLRE